MNKFKYIFFDLDGTLIDTVPLILESFEHTFIKHFGVSRPEEETISYIGMPIWNHMNSIYPGQEEELISTYMEYNLCRFERGIAIFLGIYNTLEELYKSGIIMGVITSRKKETTNKALNLFNIKQFFSYIITSEDTDKHKPHGDPIKKAMHLAGITNPAEILYVGDSTVDILCAKDAGTYSAAVAWTYNIVDRLLETKPDFFLKTPGDLLILK